MDKNSMFYLLSSLVYAIVASVFIYTIIRGVNQKGISMDVIIISILSVALLIVSLLPLFAKRFRNRITLSSSFITIIIGIILLVMLIAGTTSLDKFFSEGHAGYGLAILGTFFILPIGIILSIVLLVVGVIKGALTPK